MNDIFFSASQLVCALPSKVTFESWLSCRKLSLRLTPERGWRFYSESTQHLVGSTFTYTLFSFRASFLSFQDLWYQSGMCSFSSTAIRVYTGSNIPVICLLVYVCFIYSWRLRPQVRLLAAGANYGQTWRWVLANRQYFVGKRVCMTTKNLRIHLMQFQVDRWMHVTAGGLFYSGVRTCCVMKGWLKIRPSPVEEKQPLRCFLMQLVNLGKNQVAVLYWSGNL